MYLSDQSCHPSSKHNSRLKMHRGTLRILLGRRTAGKQKGNSHISASTSRTTPRSFKPPPSLPPCHSHTLFGLCPGKARVRVFLAKNHPAHHEFACNSVLQSLLCSCAHSAEMGTGHLQGWSQTPAPGQSTVPSQLSLHMGECRALVPKSHLSPNLSHLTSYTPGKAIDTYKSEQLLANTRNCSTRNSTRHWPVYLRDLAIAKKSFDFSVRDEEWYQ